MKNSKLIKNLYYCVITPAIIGGLASSGFFFLVSSFEKNPFSIPVTVFLSGMLAYLIGSLIRILFTWEDELKDVELVMK